MHQQYRSIAYRSQLEADYEADAAAPLLASLGNEAISRRRYEDDYGCVTILPGGMCYRASKPVYYPRGKTTEAGIRFSASSTRADGLANNRRGQIRGFSARSARRMRRMLASIDYRARPSLFVSLTYHLEWGDAAACYADLDAWWKRVQRRWGGQVTGCLWKKEYQSRGAPHFHVWVFCARELRRDWETWWRVFRRWCERAWSDVVGENWNKHHRRYGCKVVECDYRQPSRLMRYLAKYMSKQFYNDEPTGRTWGYRGRVPTAVIASVQVTTLEGIDELARRLRRWGRGSRYCGSLNRHWRGWLVWGDGRTMPQLLRGLAIEILPNWHTSGFLGGRPDNRMRGRPDNRVLGGRLDNRMRGRPDNRVLARRWVTAEASTGATAEMMQPAASRDDAGTTIIRSL